MNSHGLAYLIYRPALDYEESISPYLICATQAQADAVIAEIGAWLDRFCKRLPKYPEVMDDDPDSEIGGEKWLAVDERCKAIFAKARWPYDLAELKHDIRFEDHSRRHVFDGSLKAMPLTFLSVEKRKGAK